MPVLKKGEIKVRATAYGTEVKSTDYVFYSYDKKASALFFQFRNQNGETTDIANAKIRLLLIKNDDEGKEFIPSQEDFEIISKPGGTAKFVLPEMLLAYQGKVTGYIYLDFEDGSQTDEGQFTFRIRRSMITHVLPAMGDKYVQDFEDITERVKQAEDKAKKDMQNSVDQVNKDYEAWKDTQVNKQSKYENDFSNWKTAQEDKQSTFEKDFSDWEAKQKKAQEDFEDNTKNTVKNIDDVLDSTDKKVNDVNNKINNLDVYTKNEVDEKLDNKTSKKDFDSFTEHGFLSLESGFKNADGDNASTSMQYMRVGNLMNIFGAVENQKVLNKDSDHLVAKLPERLKVFINDTRVCQASGNDLFTARINESESENYPNQIFIYRFRGGNGISKDFEAGRWINISLTCAVKVVD
ncbi:BppU family phage baseplate upper protein [Tetragenococcus halophilus]|uniref:BppU family phage baseplate upper protein n=1 Tax=Tetragenococcus halophilus TaxID=51669 RepID=UPI0030C93319